MPRVQPCMRVRSPGSERGHRRPRPSLSPAPLSSPPRVLHLEDKEMLQSYTQRSYCILTAYNRFLQGPTRFVTWEPEKLWWRSWWESVAIWFVWLVRHLTLCQPCKQLWCHSRSCWSVKVYYVSLLQSKVRGQPCCNSLFLVQTAQNDSNK